MCCQSIYKFAKFQLFCISRRRCTAWCLTFSKLLQLAWRNSHSLNSVTTLCHRLTMAATLQLRSQQQQSNWPPPNSHMASDGHMTCYDVNSEFIALPHVTLAGLLAATLIRYSRHLARGQWLFSTFPNYNHPYTFGAPRLVCAQCTISSNFNCCRTSHRRLE